MGRRSRWVRIATWVLPVVLVAALGLSLHSQYSSVRGDLARLSLWTVVAAIALSTAGVGASMLSWRALLADLGSALPLKAAVRVYSFSQLGKYVPGSVWPVLAQMELGRAYGVPRVRAATAFLLGVLVSVVTAVAAGGLLALSTAGWGRLFALLPLVLVFLHPTLLRPLIGLAARLLRRAGAAEPPTLSGVTRGAGWSVGLWLLLGAASTVLAHGLGADVSYLRVVAAVALAWAAGLVIVFAPAGAGVRESVLVLLLAGQIGTGRAVALALLSRLAMSAADGIWALVAVAARHRRPVAGAGGEEPRSARTVV
jgi:uncharacterized membrane protein YbhN (UPF0104 family)